ncbi:MAG: hypothetical protein AB8G77_15100 [Rhodothermales bacterium]
MQTEIISPPRTFDLKSIGLTILAFMVASFGVQALSHFVINVSHYAGISIMRTEPIIPLGILAMVVQGAILGILFQRIQMNGSVMRNALMFSLMMGLFLAIYIAVVEPSKYIVPSIGAWVLVEGIASTVQFGLFGVLLGLIHRKS